MGGHVSIQPTQTGPTLPVAGPGTRASDSDRDAAAGLLNEAFAEGRLTADEHDQRLSAAYAARSWQQLHQLTADLPAPPDAADRNMPGIFAGADLCLLCVLLVVCPPAGIVWWLISRRRPVVAPAGAGRRVGPYAQDR
jgi:hypothetical protein